MIVGTVEVRGVVVEVGIRVETVFVAGAGGE